jgi:Ca2+/H+ antiporter, TMEM165/GDT1 family
MNPLALAVTTFFASAVEFVEAATIVLAVGITQGWRAALAGSATAALALAAVVAAGGFLVTALDVIVAAMQLVVGPLLILFGAWWLRKAILRWAGRKALRDEAAAYVREVGALRIENTRGFAVAFQGVFIEGLEVVVIVVGFTAGAPYLVGWSAGGAFCALLLVTLAAVALRAPLARVPENLLKTIVGIMLVSVGAFWLGEGLRVRWPFGDATLLALIACTTAIVVALVAALRTRGAPSVEQ